MPDQTGQDSGSAEEEEQAAFLDALKQQNAAFALVARLFRVEVDEDLLEQLLQTKYPASTGNEHLDAGYRHLVIYLNGTWERTRGELASDFLHTFIGVTQDMSHVAYPYESVYTSPEHMMMQDARDEVLAAYRQAQVILKDAHNEPEDHIAFELEFVRLLGERAAEALEDGDEETCADLLQTRKDFLEKHLLNWVPNLCADIQRIAQTGFYQALADILLGLIEVDEDFLENALA